MRTSPTRFPPWWGDIAVTSWTRSRDKIFREWWACRTHAVPLEDAIVEAALAFGHGARSAYAHHTSWATLASQLRVDWIGLGYVGPVGWDQIAEIVRHAWSRA
jgi:hypothetical protein